MDLFDIRRIILTAVASDDLLAKSMVLKGGNALELIHQIGDRASVDLDFSVAQDFDDPDQTEVRLFRALSDRFDSAGFLVFDTRFGPRPTDRLHGTNWGGYLAEFKLIKKERARELGANIESMRREAQVSGPGHKRTFRIEISAFEHVEGSQAAVVDHYTCYVYSIDMIAAEKLRAICQQSPGYGMRRHPTARARDFYDIFVAVTRGGVDFNSPETQALVQTVFEIKEVDLHLLGAIEEQREFHRADWASVEAAVPKSLESFDYYFDEVKSQIRNLETLWVI